MNKQIRNAIVLGVLALPAASWATNGYWSTGYGTKSKSIAGACVGMRMGAMCAGINPGSLAFVGNRIEAGMAIFSPTRGFTANPDMEMPPKNFAFIPPGEYESGNDFFLIPHFAYNRQLDSESTLGIAIGGNGGLNTEYDAPMQSIIPMPAIFSAFNPSNQPSMAQMPGINQFDATSNTGIDMMQLFIGLSYSRKINEDHAFGITPIFAIQSFQASGLEPFKMFSKHPDKVTNNGRDISYGGGLRVGWSGEVVDGLVLGASYQTRMYMTPFEEYKGLFAEEGDFDIPPNFDIGFAWKFAPDWTLAVDYQRLLFSKVKAVGNTSNIVFSPDRVGPAVAAMYASMGMQAMPGMGENPALGSDNGLGFGWDDMNVLKLGLEWRYSPAWTFRAGYSHASDAIPSAQALFNILAPATVKDHYTFGFSHTMQNDHELNFAFTYAANGKIEGRNPNTGPQTGHIEMDQWEIELGWSKRF